MRHFYYSFLPIEDCSTGSRKLGFLKLFSRRTLLYLLSRSKLDYGSSIFLVNVLKLTGRSDFSIQGWALIEKIHHVVSEHRINHLSPFLSIVCSSGHTMQHSAQNRTQLQNCTMCPPLDLLRVTSSQKKLNSQE